MSKGYLLDTNIAIAILTNESNVIDFVQQASRDKMPIYFSAITVSDMSEIAKLAGTLRRDLKGKGHKLKTPDALIIATAAVHELTLVSRDSDMKFVQDELDIPLLNIDLN